MKPIFSITNKKYCIILIIKITIKRLRAKYYFVIYVFCKIILKILDKYQIFILCLYHKTTKS